MEIRKMTCPKCGGAVKLDGNLAGGVCPSCGSKFGLGADARTANRRHFLVNTEKKQKKLEKLQIICCFLEKDVVLYKYKE